MRRRSNLLVLLGIAFFVVGGVLVYLLTDDDDGPGDGEAAPVSVVVATNDIPAGTLADELIEQGRLRVRGDRRQPASSPAPSRASTSWPGPRSSRASPPTSRSPAPACSSRPAPSRCPRASRPWPCRSTSSPGAAGYVNPGDRINLYGVFSGILGERPTPRAELLLTNVEVLDVDLTIPPRRGTAPADPAQPARPAGQQHRRHLPAGAARRRRREGRSSLTEFQSLYATLTADEAAPAGPTPGRDPDTILEEEPNAGVQRLRATVAARKILVLDRSEALAEQLRAAVADLDARTRRSSPCSRVGSVAEVLEADGPFDVLVAGPSLGTRSGPGPPAADPRGAARR